MNTISPELYGRLADALKSEGSFNPERVLPHIEERLTSDEYRALNGFLGWCHANGKVFGHGNYNARYQEWRDRR